MDQKANNNTNLKPTAGRKRPQPTHKRLTAADKRLKDDSGEIELGAIVRRMDDIFGYGINCVNGRVSTALCVGNINTFSVDDSHAHVHLAVIEDNQSYTTFLSAAMTVDVSGLSWSASGSVSYAATQTGSDTYVSYVAFNQARTQIIYMNVNEATIAADAIALIKSDPSKFITKYGTHCVIGVAYGASYVGRLRFEAHSASDKETIAAAMSVSASGFGVSGSVDAQFASEKSTVSSISSYTADSYLDGGIVTGPNGEKNPNMTDPDGMVACANSLTATANGGKGNAIGFRCITWDQFPQIQDALNAIGQPNAFSFAGAAGNLAQLSTEYSKLDYIINTCTNMIQSGAYAIPGYGDTLRRMLNAAGAGQMAIQSLTIEQIEQFTPQQLAVYLISSQMTQLLSAITHNQVLVQASYYLDAAFQTPGSFSGTYAVAFPSDLYRVAEVVHDGFSNPAALYFHAGKDGAGSYLVARWDWENEVHWDGARVDIGTSSFPTGVSTAEWQGANWNKISAQLVDFNPANLYGRT